MILTRLPLLANWFYNSWDQYTSAFVLTRRVSLALARKRYDWDDRDLRDIIPSLKERRATISCILSPITSARINSPLKVLPPSVRDGVVPCRTTS